MVRIILLGPPGGGKGTVAKKLQKDFKIPVISTGEILRGEMAKGTQLGKEVKGIIARGELVPDEIILKMIRKRIEEEDCQKGYIFDGFPRNLEQAKSLDRLYHQMDQEIDQVFYFEIPFEQIIERLSKRRVCRKCGANFNLSFNPPKKENICDFCGGELYQREDDKEETIKNRLMVFAKQTLPLKDYYQKKKILTILDASLSKKAYLKIKDVIQKAQEKN
ncbi:MAG: adenylate kinase [Candidatus Caldatribacteriota bacterium]